MNYSDRLNEFDILDLLNEYHSEMRKLKHKVDFVKSKINELENELEAIKKRRDFGRSTIKFDEMSDDQSSVESAPEKEPAASFDEPKAVVKTVVTNLVKTPEPVRQKKKPGRKPQPLSLWDQMIYDSVAEYGKAMLSRDIYESIKDKATAKGVFETEDKTKVKLNQCLVKMTSKRTDLIKVNHPGRGFAYALPEWVDDNGSLPSEFIAPAEKAKKKPIVPAKKIKGFQQIESKGKRPRIKKSVVEKIASTSPKKPTK
jgi:hypothetical protein